MSIRHCIAVVLLIAAGAGCRRDMFNQPSAKPLARSDAFQNNLMASRPIIPNTVARGQLEEDSEFYSGKIGTNLVTTLPSPVTREMLERGQERYNIYCSPCHDRTGNGNGMIVQRGFPRPPSYHIDRLRQAPIGHFYDVITHGYGIMYSYAARVDPADRWAIAAYIRVLQTSQNAPLTDVPANERNQLQPKQ
jgi:mono/diheme cytochrome c family protein